LKMKKILQSRLNKINAILTYKGEDNSFLQAERKAEAGFKKVPKLGLLYLSSVLKKQEIDCKIFDQNIQNFTPAFLLNKIQEDKPLFIGFYSATQLKKEVINSIQYLRKNELSIPIIVGGPGYFSADEYLEAGADFVCNGEGEATIEELARFLLASGLPLSAIRGISYLKEGKVVNNIPRMPIEDLDTIPFPDWEAININEYGDSRIINMRRPFVTMMTSRGCFGRCTFCSSPKVWGRPRLRSVENTLSEIDYLVGRYKVRYIGFRDDIFGFNYSWLQEFCEGLIKRKYDLIWSCQTHPFVFRDKTENKLNLLRRAGCDLLILGLQKTDPEILQSIERNPQEPAVVEDIIAKARKLGIMTVLEFIFGFPGETKETIRKDLNFSKKVKPNYVHFYKLLLIEGSQLYDKYFKKDDKICDLSDDQINAYIFKAGLLFYLHPPILLSNLSKILKKPKFFLVILYYLLKQIKFKYNFLYKY
jgi:anaerobic magnesium-protoporphyrin IX monomethyl ester cyclase